MLAVCHFIFGHISNVKVFTGTVNVGPPPCPVGFSKSDKKMKMISFEAEKNFPVNFKKKTWKFRYYFKLFFEKHNFFNFFSIFYDFLKKITRFSEKITFHFTRLRSKILLNNYRFSDFCQVIQHTFNLAKIGKGQKVAPFHLRKRVIFFLRETCFFDKLAFSLNITVVMHPNGPKCLRNE